MKLPINQILCGDCIEVTKSFPDESIDLIVTDPPYGIGFMGKAWDKALPPEEAFKEMFRVLKPGALAFVMSSPRQDVLWRMMRMLEECGFQLRQSFVSWIYKSGFPKAYDVSKGIDKKPFTQYVKKLKIWLKKQIEKCPKTKKRINEECEFTATSYVKIDGKDYWTSALPTKEKWVRMKEVIGFSDEYDWVIKRNIKERGFIEPTGNIHKGSGIGIQFSGNQLDDKNPISPLAKKWQGWKSITGLKPALECVLMVNKPLREKTIVDNVLKHGVGAINVDACRIPFQNEVDKELAKPFGRVTTSHGGQLSGPRTAYEEPLERVEIPKIQNPKGRFPANLLVSDKALDTGKISKSNIRPVPLHDKGQLTPKQYGCYGAYRPKQYESGVNDVGDQSRYFDLDAWARHHGFLDVPKASKSERDKGLEKFKEVVRSGLPLSDGSGDYVVNVGGDGSKSTRRTKARNIHPTVKPIKLMAYLIELGCPRQGIVLDPFVGSGTTCIAAERLRRKWIGIDINPEVLASLRRISYAVKFRRILAFGISGSIVCNQSLQ